jgi:hypothetical protein
LADAGLEKIDSSFDYLLKLPMRSLTKENIEKHERELAALQRQIDITTKTEPFEMWMKNLSALSI